MSMMRIAVAGSGGLARLIAYYIDQETSHYVVLLSRTEQPSLAAKGFQVAVVDYEDEEDLAFALNGIDTVISTVTGANQVALLKAALRKRCRRFAPAEFEGLPSLRPDGSPLDRHRNNIQKILVKLDGRIEWTNFVCGVFYERFQPGGLKQALVGETSGFAEEGDYIMNVRNMTAQIPAVDGQGQANVAICMTSLQDVARFVTKAVDMPRWPRELCMSGERVPVLALVAVVERLKGESFQRELHSPATLRSAIQLAVVQNDRSRAVVLHTLLATSEGRYAYATSNMNTLFPGVQPVRFSEWFKRKWNLE
ncbi:hypothetical protein AMS68_000398 [Peltaster fructicola]|uniref:NAD(P)-binding domain-containing protein n=1 Tax=Peltaster fructicola TaxID=286661 RepID=A0A6H0XJR0_9PEZI|nr:hypothetical protein AMS68_000398 [Peltaster fructicola]